MPMAITDAAFDLPGVAFAAGTPASASDFRNEAPRLGGLLEVVGLVAHGLTSSWVPLCPDLVGEVSRGVGRHD